MVIELITQGYVHLFFFFFLLLRNQTKSLGLYSKKNRKQPIQINGHPLTQEGQCLWEYPLTKPAVLVLSSLSLLEHQLLHYNYEEHAEILPSGSLKLVHKCPLEQLHKWPIPLTLWSSFNKFILVMNSSFECKMRDPHYHNVFK